jgi:hypothetical protein
MKPQRAQSFSLCAPDEFPLKEITEKVISCSIEVPSTLGLGLLENIYGEAFGHEFTLRGIAHEWNKRINNLESTEGRE